MKIFFKTAIFVMAMAISTNMAFAQENPGAAGTPATTYLTIKADASGIQDANQVRATVTWYNDHNEIIKWPVTETVPKNPSGLTVLPVFMCMGSAAYVKYFVEALAFGKVVATACGTYSVSPLYHNVLTITSNMWGNCFGSQPAFPPPPDGSE